MQIYSNTKSANKSRRHLCYKT